MMVRTQTSRRCGSCCCAWSRLQVICWCPVIFFIKDVCIQWIRSNFFQAVWFLYDVAIFFMLYWIFASMKSLTSIVSIFHFYFQIKGNFVFISLLLDIVNFHFNFSFKKILLKSVQTLLCAWVTFLLQKKGLALNSLANWNRQAGYIGSGEPYHWDLFFTVSPT